MSGKAEKVYTEPGDIERIQRFVVELPSQAHGRITMKSGYIITGAVTERPAAQLFENVFGAIGMNARVRLDDPTAPAWTAYLWLGDIERVERLIEY